MMTSATHSIVTVSETPNTSEVRARHFGIKRRLLRLFLVLFAAVSAMLPQQYAAAAGTWASLNNAAPGGIGTMLLLSDGSVMAHMGGAKWARLVPDSTGSYVNGTWSLLAPMNDSRLYFASQVLKDGRVFVAGGEYGNGGNSAEVYDPKTNTWTRLPLEGQNFIDMASATLPNGNVLCSGTYSATASGTPILHIDTNTWQTGPLSNYGMGEVTWLKLPDASIMSAQGSNSERYIPALNQWVQDAVSPIPLMSGGETGPAFLLPNGNAFWMGYGQGVTYAPSGNNNPGAWTAGPVYPNSLNCGDASGAMMTNGIVLFTANPDYLAGATTYLEYDYSTNAVTIIPAAPNDYGGPAFNSNMLCLPDGKILYSSSTSTAAVYTPGSAALAAGKPTITTIAFNGDGTYTLTGKLLNGITEGASYGDDRQSVSNYPIVRLISSGGTVYYARTSSWSSTGVQTGNTSQTTKFTYMEFNAAFGGRRAIVFSQCQQRGEKHDRHVYSCRQLHLHCYDHRCERSLHDQ
jgi:hypothetical protein